MTSATKPLSITTTPAAALGARSAVSATGGKPDTQRAPASAGAAAPAAASLAVVAKRVVPIGIQNGHTESKALQSIKKPAIGEVSQTMLNAIYDEDEDGQPVIRIGGNEEDDASTEGTEHSGDDDEITEWVANRTTAAASATSIPGGLSAGNPHARPVLLVGHDKNGLPDLGKDAESLFPVASREAIFAELWGELWGALRDTHNINVVAEPPKVGPYYVLWLCTQFAGTLPPKTADVMLKEADDAFSKQRPGQMGPGQPGHPLYIRIVFVYGTVETNVVQGLIPRVAQPGLPVSVIMPRSTTGLAAITSLSLSAGSIGRYVGASIRQARNAGAAASARK